MLAVLFSAQVIAAPAVRQYPPGSLQRMDQLPSGRFRQHLEQLPQAAQDRAMAWLRSFHFTEMDLDTLRLDSEGGVYYVDDLGVVTTTNTTPTTSEAAVPVSPFPSSLIFHSRPGAPNVIFLAFDGETVTGTQWNADLGRTTIVALPFSIDTDTSTFSDAEQTAIKRIWERVSEDYAPFNVDVTTQRPATFTTRTAEALITCTTDASGQPNPSNTAGGIAYVSVFATSSYAKYRPAWIYYNNLASREDYIAEAASHEVGHNFGLSHQGTTTQGYYGGHGTGDTSWGPIMGTGYDRNVSQWCKGEYYNANNTQDELAVISASAPYVQDDHSSAISNATPLQVTATGAVSSTTPETDPTRTNTANKGVISSPGDTDVFSFSTGTGAINLSITPWVSPADTHGGNLDVVAQLLDGSGAVLLTNNVATLTGAVVQTNLPGGTYYLCISACGTGDPMSSTPTGYTAYGSLGQFFINGTVQPPDSTSITAYTTQYPTPYWWLIANGYTNNFESAVTNIGANGYLVWQSYIAGLTPGDPASKLLLAIRRVSGGTALSWSTVTNRVYTLMQSSNPAMGYTNLPGALNLPATVNAFTNPAPAQGPVFYRLNVTMP